MATGAAVNSFNAISNSNGQQLYMPSHNQQRRLVSSKERKHRNPNNGQNNNNSNSNQQQQIQMINMPIKQSKTPTRNPGDINNNLKDLKQLYNVKS